MKARIYATPAVKGLTVQTLLNMSNELSVGFITYFTGYIPIAIPVMRNRENFVETAIASKFQLLYIVNDVLTLEIPAVLFRIPEKGLLTTARYSLNCDDIPLLY